MVILLGSPEVVWLGMVRYRGSNVSFFPFFFPSFPSCLPIIHHFSISLYISLRCSLCKQPLPKAREDIQSRKNKSLNFLYQQCLGKYSGTVWITSTCLGGEKKGHVIYNASGSWPRVGGQSRILWDTVYLKNQKKKGKRW